ncbi:hypothetical protein NK638_05095 [Psychrobacter sp. A3]|uniref:hypothetical protein n=1 Tax=Psychrobacter sp. A3 TaxID=2992754 RepID=UPI00237B6314|nr:hypothetical protein [Psychrobacter sp. A3]MDE0490917.1 hypothetical protein [Psychrobacter sp. A3]
MKATFYTIVALIAFSANSLFCRMTLAEGYIDAWSFTTLRLLSAAMSLMTITKGFGVLVATECREYGK